MKTISLTEDTIDNKLTQGLLSEEDLSIIESSLAKEFSDDFIKALCVQWNDWSIDFIQVKNDLDNFVNSWEWGCGDITKGGIFKSNGGKWKNEYNTLILTKPISNIDGYYEIQVEYSIWYTKDTGCIDLNLI